MVVKIIQAILMTLLVLQLLFCYFIFKDFTSRNMLFQGIIMILFGISVGFEPEFNIDIKSRIFQIFCYAGGLYDIYQWWKNDDDFHNKRKRFLSKSKVKFKNFIVFKPPVLVGR